MPELREQAELRAVATSLEVIRFKPGERVIVEGEDGADMYLVEAGTAVCTKDGVYQSPRACGYTQTQPLKLLGT